jgi:hypothetical protein
MYFRLRKDAENWFKDVANSYPTKFDLYYLCLMVGLAAKRKGSASAGDATDMIDYFPGDFQARQSIVIGVLIARELAASGIGVSERESVHRIVSSMVTPKTPSYLTDAGVKLMNDYASGGYELLTERFEDRPRTVETFVRKYAALVRELAVQD